MRLREIVEAGTVRGVIPVSLIEATVSGLEYDSRRVEPGFVYFAIRGTRFDGRAFAAEAMKRGALAVVSDLPAPEGFNGAWIEVGDGRRTLARMARSFYAEAARDVRLIGVTGTNGKTTTTTIINSVLHTTGQVTALVGTIEYQVAGKILPAVNTTPESVDLYRLLEATRTAGGKVGVMEVSSHALAQGRVAGFEYDVAVFTNLTQDHLDFHHTMEAYFDAKQMLFLGTGEGARPPRVAVLNRDDAWGRKLRTAPESKVLWYSQESAADLRAVRVDLSTEGLRFDLEFDGKRWPVESALMGRVNVSNILAAFGACAAAGVKPEQILKGIAACRSVRGRFERVDEGQPFAVVVDYAHTDDALRNTLKTAREICSGRVITVFGCGGDRDRLKRPIMGQAAGELSDFVVVTSDNPRGEDPLTIINDALVGLRRTETRHVAEADREKGIRRALKEAGPQDIVVIAGKGHESYQILQDRTVAFDDHETAARVLREFGYRREGA